VPYRRITFDALRFAVEGYLREPSTYLDAAGDSLIESATVFTAVERVLEHLNELWMFLMQMLIAKGFGARILEEYGCCPNGIKARKSGKEGLLNWTTAMLGTMPNAFEICNRHGMTIFGSGRGCALQRTHSSECVIF
jgi:hypothetical protein